MERKGSLLAFSILAFVSNVLGSAIIPLDHYDYSEKFNCVKTSSLYLDRAILVKFSDNYLRSWPGNSDFNCISKVYSKTSETGIIAVIQELKFRKNQKCVDHVRFDRDPTDRCGDIAFGLRKTSKGTLPPPPAFVSRYSGPFVRGQALYMEDDSSGRSSPVDSRRSIVSPGAVVESYQTLETRFHVNGQHELPIDEGLHFTIAYTGFQDCDRTNVTEDLFNCGYGVCILAIYVGDGVVNCPFGDCRDEGSCEDAMATSPFITDNQNMSKVVDKTEDVALRLGKVPKSASETVGRSMAESAMAAENGLQIAKEVKNIREEFVKQNGILGHLSDVIERAAGTMGGVLRGKLTNEAEATKTKPGNPATVTSKSTPMPEKPATHYTGSMKE